MRTSLASRPLALVLVLLAGCGRPSEGEADRSIPQDAILLRVAGEGPGDWFGCAVAGVGDVDGDGVPDVAVGAHQNLNFGHGEPGYVAVVSGASGAPLQRLSSRGSLWIDGRDDHFGHALVALDDRDGDGVGELAVGAYLYDSTDENTGGLLVVSGASGELLEVLAGELWGDRLGYALQPFADSNGDGRQDLLLGVEKTDGGVENSGSLQLVCGATFAPLLRVDGPGYNAHLGCSVAAVGDVDGDGIDDLAGGAFLATREGQGAGRQGFAAIYSGADGALLRSWWGRASKDYLGFSVEGLGDLDGDGVGDLAIGAIQSGYVGDYTGPGYVIAVSGADGRLLWELHGEASGDQLGWSLENVGDRDGDGRAELVVGAPASIAVTDSSLGRRGRLLLVSGAGGAVLRTFEGLSADDQFGTSVAAVGDLDGDGLDDLAVGAVENVPGQTRSGYAVVLSGRALKP